MSGMNRQEDKAEKVQAAGGVDAEVDGELEQALKNFRLSVHAWSDASYSRPRAAAQRVQRRSWRSAVGWALGCVLVAGSVSGGLFERQHQIELRQMVARQWAVEHAKQFEEQQARAQVSDEALLSGVDSDVSRQVPSALEPLAQMMATDGTK